MIKKIIIITFFVLFLFSCSQEELKIQKHYKTTFVSTWTLETSENYLAYAKWIKESFLSIKNPWKIIQMNFSKWDYVNKWDLLSFVDQSSFNSSLQTSNSINETLIDLKKSIEESYDKQISILEQDLKKTIILDQSNQTNISDTNKINDTNLELQKNQITTSQNYLKSVQVELEETKNIYDWKIEKLYNSSESSITSSYIIFTDIIRYSDEFLWVTNENESKNDQIEDYIWAKDRDIYNKSKNTFLDTNIKFLEYKSFYEENIENKDTISNENIILWLENWKDLSWDMKELLRLTYETLDNSIENYYFSLEEINSKKQYLIELWNKIEQSLLTVSWDYTYWLKWTLDSLDSLKREYQKAVKLLEEKIKLAEDNLEIAKNSYENIKVLWETNINKNTSSKEVSEIDIEQIKWQIESLKKEKETKLLEIDLNIDENSGQKNNSLISINDSKLYSPYSWLITEKFKEVWEIYSPWENIYLLADDSKIKLELYVWDDILEGLFIWKTVKIKDDELLYNWLITNIAKSKDEISKKTQIEINIDNKEKKIKVWTIMKVYFWDTWSSWILVPNNSIISKYIKPWVFIKNWNIVNFKQIEIIEQDTDFSLVNWIEIWDELIVEWQENIFDWEKLF